MSKMAREVYHGIGSLITLVGTKTEMCRGTISKVGLLTYRTFESAFNYRNI